MAEVIKVASDQPCFLPWGGYFHKHLSVDVMIYTVGVPVSHGAGDHYHNRVRLHGSWLTLPVTKDTRSGLFKSVHVVDGAVEAAAKRIRAEFGKRYPYAGRAHALALELEQTCMARHLMMINARLIRLMARGFQINALQPPEAPQTVWDVREPDPALSKTERLIQRVRRVVPTGAVQYHMGRGALAYMDLTTMRKAGITVMLQKPLHTPADETALQLLATSDDPWQGLQTTWTWEPAL